MHLTKKNLGMASQSNINHLFYLPLYANILWIHYLVGIVLHVHKTLFGNI